MYGVIIFYFAIMSNIYILAPKNTELKHYKNIIMDENYIKSIKQIGDYIKNSENDVYILDACSALYMIPIDRYNKNFDMFLKGNLGAKGENGQIEKIKEMKNAKILIMNNNYPRNWQNPEMVRYYIVNNLEYVETVGIYDVYKK